jgi:hypothetical protein
MHRDCAQYALQVCPYLAAPHFRYAESMSEKHGYRVTTTDLVSPQRPVKFFLATSTAFEIVRAEDGTPVIHSGPWLTTQWWKDGALFTQ